MCVHKSVYMRSQIFVVYTTADPQLWRLCVCVCVCVCLCVCTLSKCVYVRPPAGSLQRALVRISCPLDTTSSVSMPPIDGRIDPLFDCLDNLCEFQHNASHSGFKDARPRLAATCPRTYRQRELLGYKARVSPRGV